MDEFFKLYNEKESIYGFSLNIQHNENAWYLSIGYKGECEDLIVEVIEYSQNDSEHIFKKALIDFKSWLGKNL